MDHFIVIMVGCYIQRCVYYLFFSLIMFFQVIFKICMIMMKKVSTMQKSMAKAVGEYLCFQTLETKYSQVVVLNGLHMPGPSEIVQSHKIVVNNPLCGKHRSYVTNDTELRLEKCIRDYSNETVTDPTALMQLNMHYALYFYEQFIPRK